MSTTAPQRDSNSTTHAGSVARACWCGAQCARSLGTFTLSNGRQYPWVECESCGVQAIHPQPDDAELLASYSAEYYGSSRRKFIWPFSSIVGWFQAGRARMSARCMPPGGRVLDVGCGNGGYLLHMSRMGFIAEGTEWTSDSAARVPQNAGIKVHVGDLLSLPLPGQQYDMITMWHVLEHVRQPDKVLQRIWTLLKPGGTLYLALPNAESRQAMRFREAWLHHDPPRHLFGFGVKSLSGLLHSIGFTIERVSTNSLEQNVFGHIQSWLNERGYPRDRLYEQLKGLNRHATGTRLSDAMWMLALAVPALIVSTLQAMQGRGATMTLRVRKPASAG